MVDCGGNGKWGQFLTSEGTLNEERTNEFLEKLDRAHTEEEVFDSFPLKLYDTEAPISTFYKFLDIVDN